MLGLQFPLYLILPSLSLVKETPPPISLPVFPREKASYEYEIGGRAHGTKSKGRVLVQMHGEAK